MSLSKSHFLQRGGKTVCKNYIFVEKVDVNAVAYYNTSKFYKKRCLYTVKVQDFLIPKPISTEKGLI